MPTTFNAQEYLEKNIDKDEEIISNQTVVGLTNMANLIVIEGELIIKDYPNLTEIELTNQQLTSLEVVNCPNLKSLNIRENNLTQLVVNTPNLQELIAGQNELTSLDLVNCPKLKKLMISDNPTLTEIINLNLASLNNLNISNTNYSLNSEIAELKEQNERLIKALSKINEARLEKELKWVEPIQTAKQSEEAIQRHLKSIESNWRAYFESKNPAETRVQNPLLSLSFDHPDLNWKAKAVLAKVVEAITNRNYSELIYFWNEGTEFNPNYEFDGSLEHLMKLWQGHQLLLTKQKQI